MIINFLLKNLAARLVESLRGMRSLLRFSPLQKKLQVKAIGRDGKETAFDVTSRLDTAVVPILKTVVFCRMCCVRK